MDETIFTGFVDRADAGRRLAKELRRYRGKPDTVVVGLPRGGVVTAAAVADELDLPLDVPLGQPPLDIAGKTVIVVDDGMATGSTVSAALAALRNQRAKRIVLAVPVAPLETLERIRPSVDELVYLETPEPFGAIGYWYIDFSQVTDEEVMATLARARGAVIA